MNKRCQLSGLSLAFIFFLVASPSAAQQSRFPGFYITAQHDTVPGFFPGYKQWSSNPESVHFVSASGAAVQLNPFNAVKFHVEGYDTYVAYRGQRLVNPIGYNGASVDKNDRFDSLSTFLQQIATSGDYRFYMYRDNQRINLFYSKDDRTFTELLQKAAIVDNAFWQSDTYKSQLMAIFPGDAVRPSIMSLRYTPAAIASFVNRTAGQKKSIGKSANVNQGFVIMAGVSHNSFGFSGETILESSEKDYPSGLSPVVSLGYMISSKRNFEKIYWFPQLKVYSFSHTAKTYHNNDEYPATFNTFKSSAVVSLGFHFGYNIINNDNVKWSLLPGGGINLFVNNRQIDEFKASATRESSVETEMQRATYLLDIQSMLQIKKHFLIWAGYNFPVPVTSGADKGKISSIQAGAGYRF